MMIAVFETSLNNFFWALGHIGDNKGNVGGIDGNLPLNWIGVIKFRKNYIVPIFKVVKVILEQVHFSSVFWTPLSTKTPKVVEYNDSVSMFVVK